jgi:hypothetical protein
MKKAELASEFSGILHLLREHAFLRYSINGRQEYDQRLLSASSMFANLVSRATGLGLPPPPPQYAELDKVSDGSYAGLVRTARKIVVRLRRKPVACSTQETQRLERMCMVWEKAAMLLSSLRD